MNEDQKIAKKYQRIKLILSLSESILSFILICLFVYFNYNVWLRDYSAQVVQNAYLQLLVFVAVIGFTLSLISAPLSFISGFWLEHHFNLSNQKFFSCIWEQTKMFLLSLVLLIPVLLIFYFFLRNFPQSWWLWTASFLFLFSVVIGKIAPQIIFPLFYKFEPLDDENLLSRMQTLAEKGRFALEGVYRFDMSKNTKKANAAFTGLGKSRRIILGDTLLDDFSLDEIESVFAHEVGHYVHGHMTKGVIRATITNFAGFFIASLVYGWWIAKLNLSGVADLAALPLLSIILAVFGLLTSPFDNFISRRDERQADNYALRNSSKPQAFITAMQKLTKMNLSDKEPSPLVEFLFHSHPSIKSRVEFAQRFLEEKSQLNGPAV